MSTAMLWAVTPVKPFAFAKQRLAPMLNPDERAALACAMFDDVLRALVSSPCLSGVLVVTGDTRAAAIARKLGADVLWDPPEAGLTMAVRHAARALAATRCAGMLVVPADLPLIKPSDIELIGRGHRAAPSVTLVAACSDGGTNALACSPPDAQLVCFGQDSFRQHHNAALGLGLVPTVLTLPHFGRDIDRPADLLTFLEHPSATSTCSYLVSSGIARRLGVPWASDRAANGPNASLLNPLPAKPTALY